MNTIHNNGRVSLIMTSRPDVIGMMGIGFGKSSPNLVFRKPPYPSGEIIATSLRLHWVILVSKGNYPNITNLIKVSESLFNFPTYRYRYR